MPSPIGHGLGAIAAGWAIARPAGPRGALFRQTAILAALGAAADLDLLLGRHSGETHSLGAAVLVASIAAWRLWPLASGRGWIWVAAFAAWATHPLFDAFGSDTAPPIGVMAFWPVTSAYFQIGYELFEPITREWWVAGFLRHNLLAAVREVVIVGPIVALVWRLRRQA